MSPEQIKSLRANNQLTQQELAYKLNTTPVTVSRWERAESKPSKTFIAQMLKMG